MNYVFPTQVSVHPLMQHVPLWILKSRIKAKTYKPINFATVVTDFTTCHNTWFSPGVTRCFVPTEFCKKLGIRMGLKEEQLSTYGETCRYLEKPETLTLPETLT